MLIGSMMKRISYLLLVIPDACDHLFFVTLSANYFDGEGKREISDKPNFLFLK